MRIVVGGRDQESVRLDGKIEQGLGTRRRPASTGAEIARVGALMLPDGTVDTLLKPENKDMLTKVLTAHVVSGELSSTDLMRRAKANGGRYNMQTVSGDALTAVIKGKNLYIFDESGGASKITIADVNQSNGVIHVVNKVLLPK